MKLNNDIIIGTGSISKSNQDYIINLIKTKKYKSALEIGTHIGISGEAILIGLEGIGERFDTVDIMDVNSTSTTKYEKYHPTTLPFQRFKKYTTPYFFYNRGSDFFFANDWKQKYDFIFIDGGHKKEQVKKDIIHALRALAPGGTILLHDYYPDCKPLFSDRAVISGPYLAVKELISEGARIKAHPVGKVLNGDATSFCVLEVIK